MPDPLFPPDITRLARAILDQCRARGFRISTAESCTGGLIAGCLTEIAGSSDVFDRGMVTYSNDAKTEQLGVPPSLIEIHGAVSESVARAMAEGALSHSLGDIAVAVTGVAGPGGGSPEKPVGLVHFGLAMRGAETRSRHEIFAGDRGDIRLATVHAALGMLDEASRA